MSTERTNEFHACPCCGWWGLEYPAYDKLPQPPFGDLGQPPYSERYGNASFQCCHCCGFEFGYDCDPAASGRHGTFRDYLREWAEAGRNWLRPLERPEDWSLPAQLTAAGLPPLDQ